MEYKFHKGDYVALSDKNGVLHGYVREYMKPSFSNEHCFVFQWEDGTQTGWSGNIQELPHNFVRIGQYDFTKKDDGKIEPLCEEYTKSFPVCKTTTTESGSEWSSIDIGAMGRKINELVSIVNKLEEIK